MRIEQLERDTSVVDFTIRLLASLVTSENSDVIRGLLRDAPPWVIFLPEVDVDTFVTELVTVTQGAVELGNLAPVAVRPGLSVRSRKAGPRLVSGPQDRCAQPLAGQQG